jgi:hypothetical protein
MLRRKNVAWKSIKKFYFKRKIRNFSGMGLLMGCTWYLASATGSQPISRPIPTRQDEATSQYWDLKIPLEKRVPSQC